MIHERKETKEDSPDFLSEGNFLTRHMEWRKTKHKVKVKVKSLSHVQLFATPWTVAHQAPLSMGFSRQEYWSGLPFPPLGDLPDPGMQYLGTISKMTERSLFITSANHSVSQ